MAVTLEWDDAKNRGNIAKHGLGFDEALRVFAGSHDQGRGYRCGDPHCFSPEGDSLGKEVI